MKYQPDVIITAGGTKEPIDDVRYVGNFSSGQFGHSLAQQYALKGHKVVLLAPKSVTQRFGKIEGVTNAHFGSADDLKQLLLGYRAAELVLHSAAVSDYTPTRQQGKISSDREQLTIGLIRTPKILPLLRGHFGEATTLVGFKLLSKVPTEKLITVATAQIGKNKTDYSVANRLEDIDHENGERKVHLVGPSGELDMFDGPTASVAQKLYETIAWGGK